MPRTPHRPIACLMRTVAAFAIAAGLTACGAKATTPQEPAALANVSESGRTEEAYQEALEQRFEAGVTLVGQETSQTTGTPAQFSELEPQTAAPTKPARKPWTVMVYIVGTNLESESPNGEASIDIDEMAAAGVDFSQANVLYMTGGAKSWKKDIPNDKNVVWDLATGQPVAVSEANSMGDPATLASFVNFADAYYPAEHTALVMWDHGGGPVLGFGEDELAADDGLSLPEMATAMEQTRYHGGTKIDVVGFDACLMGSVEIADVWAPYAKWMVASEESEASGGWDWHYLSVLNGAPKPAAFCEAIVSNFKTFYELQNQQGGLGRIDYTLAALDLSVMPEVRNAIDELAVALKYDVDAGDYSKINAARDGACEFGFLIVQGRVIRHDLFDLADFATRLGSSQPKEAGRVSEALSRLIRYNTANIEGANGVSIYFPSNNPSMWTLAQRGMGTPLGDAYRELESSYADRWNQQSDTEWTLINLNPAKAPGEAALSPDGTEYLVPLDEEQLADLSHASYSVLAYDDTSYQRVLCDVRVEPDDDGVLHVPVDPKVVVATSDGLDTPMPLLAQQVAADRYVCPTVRLISDVSDADSYDDVSLVFVAGEDDGLLLTAAPFASQGVTSSRLSANLSDYQAIASLYGHNVKPTRDDDGLLPHTLWDEADDDYRYAWTDIDESLAFGLQPASELGLKVSCQVVLTDQNGAQHGTELFELGGQSS